MVADADAPGCGATSRTDQAIDIVERGHGSRPRSSASPSAARLACEREPRREAAPAASSPRAHERSPQAAWTGGPPLGGAGRVGHRCSMDRAASRLTRTSWARSASSLVGLEDGMPEQCMAIFDDLHTLRRESFRQRITRRSPEDGRGTSGARPRLSAASSDTGQAIVPGLVRQATVSDKPVAYAPSLARHADVAGRRGVLRPCGSPAPARAGCLREFVLRRVRAAAGHALGWPQPAAVSSGGDPRA